MSNGENIPGPEQQRSATSDDAETEAALMSAGRLDEVARRSEHRRRERFLDTLSIGRIALMGLLIAAVIVVIPIMGWHYFGPEELAWMTPKQIDRAETAIAGSAASFIILFLRQHLWPIGTAQSVVT